MNILIVGSGGREYALGHNILKGHKDRKLYFAPGNGGTLNLGENTGIKVDDIDGLLKFALENNIDYTVVGPELPLTLGIVDKFEENEKKIFGPKELPSKFEASKSYTKKFLEKYNIATAEYGEFDDEKSAYEFAEKLLTRDGKVVLKADGLAAGKGVFIAEDKSHAQSFLKDVFSGVYGDKKVVVEEFLEGFEMSLICLTDTKTILPLPTSRDHKRAYTGEIGPNTGGMGTYAPNLMAESFMPRIKEEILNPILKGLQKENMDYRGALFIGLMITDEKIEVLEFNVRFGDPETQVILELIDNDLLELLQKTSEGKLEEVELKVNNKKALCLVLASGGYPGSYESGKEIHIGPTKSSIYYCGTKLEDGVQKTSGGRVLNLVYSGDDFDEVIETVYSDVKEVSFENMEYRKDIGPRVKRVYVAKKDEFDHESKGIQSEIENSLGIKLEGLKVYNRYDLEMSKEGIEKILYTILSEKVVDDAYFEDAMELQSKMEDTIAVAYLPGQFDQREQGILDTVSLVTDEKIAAKCAKVYEIKGATKEELKKIEKFLVNPVDSHRVELLNIPTTLKKELKTTDKNEIYEGFINFSEGELENFLEEKSLAMNLDDLKCIRDYFKSEKRDPSETEIRILDTYWSDHCRHTTFNTFLDINFDEKTELDRIIKNSFDEYIKIREELKIEKPINLMSFGTILSKYLRSKGRLEDLEVSSEINACSVKIKTRIDIDGKEELRDYLLMFKNETHNHPTEIEPFGGASTCLGGAIRDPLSGRSYVYQAMRITGAADPRDKNTMAGKLPQKKITTEAAHGYSSYGNQIGLATGLVDEIYHPGYVAKRMETGAVIAAAPMKNVVRHEPEAGDVVVLLGGKTGRDGIGGATGSSKSHSTTSIVTESAQVQKGNAPEERKIQRLFRREEATRLIKKCNDFGAGGVSVAVGELHDGVDIFLENVPLKYEGLIPMEIAISESQERMAVVLSKNDVEEFEKYAHEENLDTNIVANITDTNRMRMYYKDKIVADLCYDFINTNGASRHMNVEVTSENFPKTLKSNDKDPKNLNKYLGDLNITSKRNLIELFDSSVGRRTVLHPLGGRESINPVDAMVALVPTLEGKSKTASIMSYGFNPYLSEESNYLGGYYAVVESLSKIVAAGGKTDKVRLSFQEFYEKLTDEKSWSKPLKSLLGAFEVSHFFETPPIGGKDSMSGTFEHISVPPTLISFAVTTEDVENIVSPEFKKMGKIGLIDIDYDENGTIDLNRLKTNYEKIYEDIKNKNIISIKVCSKGILPTIYEMAVGNTGFDVELEDLYTNKFASFVVEFKEDREFIKEIGKFQEEITVNGEKLNSKDLKDVYLHTLDSVFKGAIEEKPAKIENKKVERRLKSKNKGTKVNALVLAFLGTNSEYDTRKALEDAGAEAKIVLFKNRNEEEIKKSIDEFAKEIRKANILAVPGGFSMGDEPDGSGKFIANVLRNEKIRESIEYMLEENDGLIIGICNGFQALIKTGLLPYGKIKEIEEDDPTLTFNNSSRHIARFVSTNMLTKNGPWLSKLKKDSYKIPISHGEGRFIVNEEKLRELLENEQVVAQYEVVPNGSYYGIEAIMSKDGKILGKMGHSERVTDDLYKNIDSDIQEIFESGVSYFKEK